jgi:hypothetical protein
MVVVVVVVVVVVIIDEVKTMVERKETVMIGASRETKLMNMK